MGLNKIEHENKRTTNIKANPNVELNYVDVFRRKACRLTGVATYVSPDSNEFTILQNNFREFDYLLDGVHGIFHVTISKAQLILSPAYDHGAKEEILQKEWLAKYTELIS